VLADTRQLEAAEHVPGERTLLKIEAAMGFGGLTRSRSDRIMASMVHVRLTSDAMMEFDELPSVIQKRVTKLLVRLADYPNVSGMKGLSGRLAGKARLRTGDYRVQFHVELVEKKNRETGEVTEEVEVVVEKIGHRDGFYGA
jgi:mRNA-degrading endonuclease RelE of RelBE toxin-antitoxin system